MYIIFSRKFWASICKLFGKIPIASYEFNWNYHTLDASGVPFCSLEMYHYTEKIEFCPFIDAIQRGQSIYIFGANCEFFSPVELAGSAVNPKSLVRIQLLKLWQAVMTDFWLMSAMHCVCRECKRESMKLLSKYCASVFKHWKSFRWTCWVYWGKLQGACHGNL